MTDIEDLLHRDAEHWNATRAQPVDLDDLLPGALAASPSRSRAARKPIAAALLVAAAVACLAVFVLGSGSRPRPPTQQPRPLVTTRMGQLLVQHPPAWHYIPVAQAPMAMGSPFGWLSNRPPQQQCVTSGNRTVCEPPIRSLSPGGIYIDAGEVVHFGPPGIALHPTMQVDGRAAQITASPPRWLRPCPTGTTDHLTLLINASARPPTNAEGVDYVTACSAQPSAATTAAVKHMLATVRLSETG